MIVILKPSIDQNSIDYQITLQTLQGIPGIELQTHTTNGGQEIITEIYLIGNTEHISKDNIESLPGSRKSFGSQMNIKFWDALQVIIIALNLSITVSSFHKIISMSLPDFVL